MGIGYLKLPIVATKNIQWISQVKKRKVRSSFCFPKESINMNDQEFWNEDIYLHPWTSGTVSKMTVGDMLFSHAHSNLTS